MKDASIPHSCTKGAVWQICSLIERPIPLGDWIRQRNHEPKYLWKDSSQNQLSKCGTEEDAPVKTKDIDKLHPRVVLILCVLYKLAHGFWTHIYTWLKFFRSAGVIWLIWHWKRIVHTSWASFKIWAISVILKSYSVLLFSPWR